MPVNYQINPILQLLNPDNTISANRFLAHAIGISETIIYSALISKFTYYSNKSPEDVVNGWFFSTVADLQESTTYGEKAQKRAIDNLIKVGLISVKKQGIPQKRYFRISNDVKLIEELISNGEKIARNIKKDAIEKNKQKAEKSKEKRMANECGTNSDEMSDKSKDNNPNQTNPYLYQSIRQTSNQDFAEKPDRQTDRQIWLYISA